MDETGHKVQIFEDDFRKNVNILSCFVQLKSVFFNHLGVLDLCAYVSHHSYVCSSLEVMKRYLIM